MTRHTQWSTDEIARLRIMSRTGMTQYEAAAQLGRTYHATQQACFRHGIQWYRAGTFTVAEITRLYELAAAGATLSEAAQELGRWRSTVKRRAATLGIDFVRQRAAAGSYSTALTRRQRHIVRLVACGKTDAEIACALSMTPKQVRGQLTEIMNKTGCGNRTRLALWALREGVVSLEAAWEDEHEIPQETRTT